MQAFVVSGAVKNGVNKNVLHDDGGLLASYIYLKSVNYIIIEQNRGQLIFRQPHLKIQLNTRDYKIQLGFPNQTCSE